MSRVVLNLCAGFVVCVATTAMFADDLPSIDKRFTDETTETPDFQRHLLPMMSKIGCNGRSCHGSFQGRGGFQLSLFGYDFKMDHEGLSERIDTEDPLESYALHKATNIEEHEGGERIVPGSWQHRVFINWISGGAVGAETPATLSRLEVTPREIVFAKSGEQESLQITAVWQDGTREDVTPLCRFQSNDTSIVEVDEDGRVTAQTPGDSHVVVFYDNGIFAVPVLQPVSTSTGKNYPEVATSTEVDKLVVEKLRKLGVVPAEVCTDEEFLRRVMIDLTGTLPSPQQIREFVADRSSDKRSAKIEELLQTPAYAAWWATRFNDLIGLSVNQVNNVSFNNNRTAEQWYEWVRYRFENNVPYDQIVEGIVLAQSQNDGETYEDYSARMSEMYNDASCEKFAQQDSLPYFWARRNFQKAEDRAIGFAYTFLGTRIQCAQCHKHPFDRWTQEDFNEFQTVFSRTRYSQNGTDRDAYQEMLAALDLDTKLRGNQLRRELANYLKDGKAVPFPALVDAAPRRNARNRTAPSQARMLGGTPFDLNEFDNPREPLMAWLRGDAQELFAKAFVNRVWASYFHRGIVEPTDDLSLANPPSNEALLAHLTEGFIANEFNIHWLHREICNSDTYQRSWQPNDTNVLDERNFSRAVPRRIPAEVAIDAIAQATASSNVNNTYLQQVQKRAIAIPGTAQGRGGNNYSLTIFGKSARENNCDCERSTEPTLLQTLYLNNDNETLAAIDARNSWLAEVAKAWNVSVTSFDADSAKRPANYDDVVERYRNAIARAKSQGNRELQKKASERLKAYFQRYGKPAAEEVADAGNSTGGRDIKLQPVIEEAYLRTVGRFPNEQERSVAVETIESAENPIDGLRDLMWALLNTKEFIVNH